MGAMAPEITSLELFTQLFIKVQVKENIKLRVTGPCVGT